MKIVGMHHHFAIKSNSAYVCPMKIALVHDYLTQNGGAERVFELLCQRFPEADIYTSLYKPSKTIPLDGRSVTTTSLQKIPGASRYFRLLAPLYFPAFRALDLSSYDLIFSSTTGFAKAIRKPSQATHICFCHNVTRFLWDTETYLKGFKEYQSIEPILQLMFRRLRQLDIQYAMGPDVYIANSTTVAERIKRFYGRPATTINYPVDASRFRFSANKGNYFLVSSRLLSYKRIDIIVEAFNQLGWPLIITGDGPERKRLEEIAKDNIQFLGYISDERRAQLMANARMMIVAALEDYGLVPIESNISGTPVVSYGAGGVTDTQKPGVTGLFFEQQTADSLKSALLEATKIDWDHHKIRDYAMHRFTKEVFFEKIDSLLTSTFAPNQLESLKLSVRPVAEEIVAS